MATLPVLSRMVDYRIGVYLFLEDVTVHAGHEVLMEVDNNILLIDGN